MNRLEKVKQIIAEELGCENVSGETTLEDLGVDSLEFVSLMQAIGRELGEIPEEKWAQIETVGDIADLLNGDPARSSVRDMHWGAQW